MIAIVLDLETTVQKVGDDKDNSPYNPDNKCVSAHWLEIDPLGIPGAVSTLVFHHNEKPIPDHREALQAALDGADVLVAHNAKFDVSWLREMGFRLPQSVWCTMIGEYIFSRGQRAELSLEKTALRRRVTAKKSELINDLFKSGTGFEAMPLDIVIEYAEADVQSCAEVYLKQLDDLEGASNKGLKPVFDLMFDMLDFLVEIESNGVKIDLETLSDVEVEFRTEKDKIEKRLNEIVRDVMGDTPINLNSGIDMTRVVYSRRVHDRELHQKMFNIGLNAAGKPLPPPRMKPTEFSAAVRATTEVVYRTVLHCCPVCKGTGKQCKYTKAGQLYKVQPRCMECGGGGALYVPDGRVAGLRLVPVGPADASINGFKVDKATIKSLIVQAEIKKRPIAMEFLTKISRLNAINTYLDSFVKGIQTWTRHDSVLHPNFNQTVAATARLSSTKPGFQNQPKGGKFPVRKCVVSRFENGQILEADFSGLEFRVAGELSKDPQIFEDITNGKDVHKQTASIINQKPVSEVTKEERQGAKAYCVPMDTEILTKTGWKTYSQIAVGDVVLTYNQEKNIQEWQPILELVTFENEKVIEYGHSHWTVRTTPNHRWYGFRRRERGGGQRVYENDVFTAEQITNEHRITTTAPVVNQQDLPITPEEAAILGWIVTDGTYQFSKRPDGPARANGRKHGAYACVVQKKAKFISDLEVLLEGRLTQITEDENQVKKFHLTAEAFRTIWRKAELDMFNPDWVSFITRLGPDCLYEFMFAARCAEGSLRDHGQFRISQNMGSLAEALRIGLHLMGMDTRLTRILSRTNKFHDIVTGRKKTYVTAQRFKMIAETIETVWCPRTTNGTWVMRQGKVVTVTGNTFAPLYGGMGANEAPHVQKYFQEFFQIYKGLAAYHKVLMDGVLKDGIVRIPSGREYIWPSAKRLRNGRITNATQVVNYPVQGFATGDIVPLACIRAVRAFRERKLQSKLILTVHDSIVVDVCPGEVTQVAEALAWAMKGVKEEILTRFGYEFILPLDIEIEAGKNWMEMSPVPLT